MSSGDLQTLSLSVDMAGMADMERFASDALLFPLIAHLALIAALYAWLSVERFFNAQKGATPYANLATPGQETGRTARIAANLSNQFELPMLFYPVILVLWSAQTGYPLDVILAWAFVAGRFLHTLVHTLTGQVVLRGLVFSINFVALAGLWLGFFLSAFGLGWSSLPGLQL